MGYDKIDDKVGGKMAGVIAHLYIGQLIYKSISDKVEDEIGYYLGTIAPDAVMSKDNYHRDDKKISHLRVGISSDDWYLDEYNELFNSRIKELYTKYNNGYNNSFLFGYLVHLLTDQAFHYSFRKDITEKLKSNGLPHTGKDLLKVMTNELDALDYKLVNDNKGILDIIKEMDKVCSNYSLDTMIDNITLCNNFEWIKDKYISNIEKSRFEQFEEKDLSNLFESIEKEVLIKFNSLLNEV
ncbi:MAG: hypothetical protein KQ78_02032 [Candidatus Izimaplasma bacterium HR2]|nr:MAG: hypothetical protein KQ78_02032 [Candidatus Izimaplasma bacterium HR2]